MGEKDLEGVKVMARRGDGLVLRSKTWWLDFTFRGIVKIFVILRTRPATVQPGSSQILS
jgi:hypothetical protein